MLLGIDMGVNKTIVGAWQHATVVTLPIRYRSHKNFYLPPNRPLMKLSNFQEQILSEIAEIKNQAQALRQ